MCEVRTLGPSTLAKRSTVTATSGFFSANSPSEASASTTSRSMLVRGGCERAMVSSKKAGSSCSQP
jgi:hypothetical protein